MNLQDIDVLKVYVLLSLFLVFAAAVGVVVLTEWMDRRDRGRFPAE